MEQKHVLLLLAALGVGIGLGVGVGTWVGEKNVLLSVFSVVIGLIVGLGIWFGFGGDSDDSNHISENQIVKGLKKLVIDGKDSKVTFDDFPYYLRYCMKCNINESLNNLHFKFVVLCLYPVFDCEKLIELS